MSPSTPGYGQISPSERLHLLTFSLASGMDPAHFFTFSYTAVNLRGYLGLNTVRTFASYVFSSERKYKTWKRFHGEADGRYVTERLNIPELQYRRPATYVSYNQFIQETGLESNVEILASSGPSMDGAKRDLTMTSTGAKLLWIGRKRHDKVILYLHGIFLNFS